MGMNDSNEKSYNDAEIVNYYSNFVSAGLFHYEELLIDKYFISGGKTLDIGCGAGRVTIPLFEKGYTVIGMDYAEEMIKAAKNINSAVDFRVGNILSTTFSDHEFDNIIFSFNGLMLLGTYDDRLAATMEIRRIIKESGNFIFTTPYLDNKVMKPYWKEKAELLGIDVNNMSWEQQLELGEEHLEDYDNDFFLHVPFLSEIEKMIDDAGMEVLFSARRLDYSGLEKMEDELDDNYLWVATCKK
ncbi:MAG TPA: methyltransferase domain-containing protein [Clostridia bacterium]|nr:methyltransferase domain-containing protein [Clostridia bacterium]